MDIKKYLNVLNKKEQSAILKLVDKKLTRIPNGPGLQTHPNIHLCKELKPLVAKLKEYIIRNFTIDRCWANHTDGTYINWHKHKADLSVVYYLKNKESLGTIFLVGDKIIRPKFPENSLIIFKHEIHSVPPRKKGTSKINRYSVALDISFY